MFALAQADSSVHHLNPHDYSRYSLGALLDEARLLLGRERTDAEGVERLVRCVKQQACIDDVQELIRSRSLSTRWDDSGALIVQGRLTPEQGELFLKALAHVKTVPAETSAGARDVPAETPADLTTVPAETSAHARNVPAETRLGPQRVPAETLHPETIRRLACDGGLVTLITNQTGDPLSVGRKTRAIPPATRRALVGSDRHCQYPGCSQEHYVEGHHIVHCANGGETPG